MAKSLFIPGPVDVLPEVAARMSSPMIGHRGKEFSELLEDVTEKMKRLMLTENLVFISTSSSTGLMEAAIRNCVKTRCLNVGIGAFSDRWYDITAGNGKDAEFLSVEWGGAMNREVLEGIDEKLSGGEYDAITVVHNETSTGVTNPLEEIAEVVKKHDVSLLVDCVSSMGGIKVDVDKWGIDVALFGVQKAMGLPPGLAVCSVSEQVMEKSKDVSNRGYYFDFQVFKKYLDKKQTPATPTIPHMFALDYQLDRILEQEGLENRFKRHEELGKITRQWVKKMGFELFPREKEYCSDTVTCVSNTLGIDCNELKSKLADRGYVFANGYGRLANKTFRIAHMADRQPDELRAYLETIEDILGI